ncbi:MAG TPA: response regulator transcription factor [Steroidobacteraceae bacterium]|nr:response regulator transcription factor [Steroidobacteraceae bacterium]
MDIRVMVASEVRLYRDALQRVLQEVEGIAVVGVASSAGEVVKRACMLAPGVVVIDTAMIEGFTAARPVAHAMQVGGVMVLCIPEIPAEVIACLPSGILGFVSRDGTAAVLLDAIRAAGRHGVTHKVHSGGCIDELTAREMEILRLMQQGVSNKTISRQLGIELSTVKNHVHSILAKLGVHRRGEAISLMYAHDEAARGWDLLPRLEQPGRDDVNEDDLPDVVMA